MIAKMDVRTGCVHSCYKQSKTQQEVRMIRKRILNPERVRRAGCSFGFIPHRFLSAGHWRSSTRNELLLYMFLVLAADRYGLSYYSAKRICSLLSCTFEEYEQARERLIARDLLAFDGTIFQVLELPGREDDR